LVERAALPQETEERGPRFDDVPMIDRRSECEEFRRLLRRVSEERHGQVLVIEGEAGIGKTKFARFCREAVVAQAVRVMHGAYRDHAGGAYAGIREALEELFGAEMLEREATAQRIAERLPELGYGENASEAEDLTNFLTQFLRPIPGVGEGGREGLDYVVGRIERFLRRASLHVSLLLMLEDLHWADAESMALLQHLAAVLDTDPARLLIIASMRAGDREPNAALEAALGKMARFEGTFYRRRFVRLGEDDTATLIEESLQADFEDKAAVYQLAEGNPLHVLSILRYLHSEELLDTSGTGWRVKAGVQLAEVLPPTVREVLKLRVQRLVAEHEEGPARRETLLWAAVAGRRFDVEVLAEAIREGAPHLTARLDSHLDALLEAGILEECRALPGDVLAFDHQLLREVVLADQEGPRAERARHRHLAAAKVRRVERGDRSLLPEVAHHYLEAREWAEAVRYHKLAGDSARDSLAFREAAGYYEAAVRLLKEQPGLDLSSKDRLELYFANAETLETLGQTDAALSAHRAAQEEAGEDRVHWGQSERAIAWLLSRKGQLDEAAAAGERARDALKAAGAEVDLADALRTLGVIEILRGHHETAMPNLQTALEIYEQHGPSEGLARCYGYLCVLHHSRGDLEAALDASQRSRAIHEDLGFPISVGKALNNVAYILTLLGRDDEALSLLVQAAEILERHQSEKDLPNVYHSLAQALLKCGRNDEAHQYLERGLESARRVGEVRTVADFQRLLARQAAAAGKPDEARAHFEEALQVCAGAEFKPQQAEICLEFAEFLIQTNEPAKALPLCEQALAIRRQLGTDGVAEAEAVFERARKAAPVAPA
jgi:predicted ATPase